SADRRDLPSLPTRRSSDLFPVLVRELMSSPLVTGLGHTATFDARNVVVSITRREHLCAALGNRLDLGDVCGLDYAFPQMSGFSRSEEHTSELQSRENLVCR